MNVAYPQNDKKLELKKPGTFDLGEDRKTRRKLWDLPGSCHCLVIGTCVSLSEVRSICKKCDYAIEGKSDYDLHRFVVGQACHANSDIAKRVQKLLDSKYKVDIARLRGRQSESLLLDHWRVLKDIGRVAGTLWATVTHRDCTTNVISAVYGEVHMLSHLTGASVHKKAEELPSAKRDIESLQNKMKAQQLTMTKKLEASQEKIAKLEQANTLLQQQLNGSTSSDSELGEITKRDHQIVRSALRETNMELRATRTRLSEAEIRIDGQNTRYAQLSEDNGKLENLIQFLTDKTETPDGSCDKSLSGKCLLLLGGKPSQCKHFKAYVESNDGDLLHHDGGVESSLTRIDQLISQADAVLCPVEQVSHSAMLRAKKLCKSTDKPLVFLPKSSMTAFVTGLRQLQ